MRESRWERIYVGLVWFRRGVGLGKDHELVRVSICWSLATRAKVRGSWCKGMCGLKRWAKRGEFRETDVAGNKQEGGFRVRGPTRRRAG